MDTVMSGDLESSEHTTFFRHVFQSYHVSVNEIHMENYRIHDTKRRESGRLKIKSLVGFKEIWEHQRVNNDQQALTNVLHSFWLKNWRTDIKSNKHLPQITTTELTFVNHALLRPLTRQIANKMCDLSPQVIIIDKSKCIRLQYMPPTQNMHIYVFISVSLVSPYTNNMRVEKDINKEPRAPLSSKHFLHGVALHRTLIE